MTARIDPFMNPVLHGAGRITGVFFNPAGDIAAVASTFPLLTNPRARAAYGGAALRYRVGLYWRGETLPFAVHDALRLPVNDVAFHPGKPIVAIGAGSYDGGYSFDGDLVFWNWQSGKSRRPYAAIPEVVRCRYRDDGGILEAWVRPWDEEWGDRERDPDGDWNQILDTLYRVQADDTDAAWRVRTPLTLELDEATASTGGAPTPDPGVASRLADWLGVRDLALRSAIWDIAWLDATTLGATHDGCLLDRYDTQGALIARHEGGGHGAEILRGAAVTVHAIAPPDPADIFRRDSRLYVLKDDALIAARDYPGQYTFSVAADGHLLGRQDRMGPTRPRAFDVLLDATLATERRLDAGHYDCFNHYIGINGAPALFCLQGTPPSSHEGKHLCIVHPDGRIERLWPLLQPDGTHASHAMECRGAYVDDAQGPGVVIAGKHYSPTVDNRYQGFIFRKRLARGQVVWRHATGASPTSIVPLTAAGLVAAAFLDGRLMLLDAQTGEQQLDAKICMHGIATVIYAMDARDNTLAVGTIDGRIAVISLDALLATPVTDGAIDLA
ncbi:hypothetical protein [Achromobacter sp. UMC71]|uniref:hypothetical protein n=1 Tax=Achromobacter sp. UMC71 TaxID=1862320 RepID=UPI001C8101AA|nr:hypothetical protein [Achromobacter sp. UMC71]MBB1628929.1 hypothetical protein [Achromobacter sp. UMC71]